MSHSEPTHYVCRACRREIVECIPSCPCIESEVCEECACDGREPEPPGFDPALDTGSP